MTSYLKSYIGQKLINIFEKDGWINLEFEHGTLGIKQENKNTKVLIDKIKVILLND